MWLKTGAGAVIALLALAGVYYASRVSDFAVQTVEIQGAGIVNAEAVQKLIEDKIQGTYGILIPRNNAFFIPSNDIQKSILSAFPEVKSISIKEKGFTSLSVSLTERVPVALWCAEGDSADCYALDEDGFSFMKMASSDGYVRYYGKIDGEAIGGTFLSGDFKSLNDFVMQTVSEVNRAADSVTVAENNDVTLALVGGGELRFVRTENTTATLENIASVFASQSFKTKKDFEYADFRYGSKVYVKFKGE